MSLRHRLVLVVVLAVLALGASLLAVLELRAQRAAAREAQAYEQGARIIDALDQRVGDTFSVEMLATADADRQSALRVFASSLIAPLIDASTGFCLPDGTLTAVETVAPLAFGPNRRDRAMAGDFKLPPLRLLPLDRHFVETACRNLRGNEVGHGRFAAPNDLLFVSARKVTSELAAFVLVRMPNRQKEERGWAWQANVALICGCTLLLVILTVDALVALHRGSLQVEQALARLGRDLRAPVGTPRIAELARIADGLRNMASDLASAHERERDLERRLDHEQRLAALGRVVAGVAHETRNPLAGIKLKLDLLARRPLDPRAKDDIEVCLMEIARLDRLVSTLLLVSRREPVTCVACDVAEVVRERVDVARAQAKGRGVDLEVQGEATALVQRDLLVRIVDNLLRNAVEASPAPSKVVVTWTRDEGRVQLRVGDLGPGVPLQHVEQLFEPFFTLKPEGTGLGLFLSRSLAEAQGGSLSYLRCDPMTWFELTLLAA